MYTKKDKIYSEPFKALKQEGVTAYSLPEKEGGKVEEFDVSVDDMVFNGTMFLWGENKFAQMIIKGGSYDIYKAAIVKKRYSLDDQIAIVLNKDEDEDASISFQRMQEWRSYASAVARKIMEIVEAEKSKL